MISWKTNISATILHGIVYIAGQNSNTIEVYSIKRNIWSELDVTLRKGKGHKVIANDGVDNIIIFNGTVVDTINVLTDDYKSEKLPQNKNSGGWNPCPVVIFQNHIYMLNQD